MDPAALTVLLTEAAAILRRVSDPEHYEAI
jgi:hypothetical protein